MDAMQDTSMGLMKALHFITTQPRRRKVKPKFKYASAGSTTRATRCLKTDERAAITALVGRLSVLDPKSQQDQVQEILKELSNHPVTFVPVKRELKIDYSKSYPYHSPRRYP